jgi:nucleoid-associated protein YgaU
VRRTRHLLSLVVGVVLAAVPASAAAGLLALAAPALRTAATGRAEVADLLVAGCSSAGALVLGWLALTVLVAVADELATRRHPRRPVRRSPGVPRLVRRVVALVVGVLLGSAALSAGAAERGAAVAVPEVGWAVSAPLLVASAPSPDLGWSSHAAPRAEPADRTAGEEIVVLRGDSLWSLASSRCGPDASRADVLAEQHRLYAANTDVIGDDPDLLVPGQVLRLP